LLTWLTVTGGAVHPSAFDYAAPRDVPSALSLLANHEDAKVLAGGQSLIPMMKLRFARPGLLVDLGRIRELGSVVATDAGLALGAMVLEAELADCPETARYGAVRDAAKVIADPLVRNSATIGGNLAHGDPENDQPAVMVALGANLVAHSPRGERTVPADGFFQGLYETALAEDEILTEIRLPAPADRSGSGYVKLRRQVGDFAIAAAAARVELAGAVVGDCALLFTGLGTTPVRVAANELLQGEEPRVEVLRRAAARAVDGLEIGDHGAYPADYLRRVAPRVAFDALTSATFRARGDYAEN
jgi:carbon-monoxide dehydrogenase medium subunit